MRTEWFEIRNFVRVLAQKSGQTSLKSGQMAHDGIKSKGKALQGQIFHGKTDKNDVYLRFCPFAFFALQRTKGMWYHFYKYTMGGAIWINGL